MHIYWHSLFSAVYAPPNPGSMLQLIQLNAGLSVTEVLFLFCVHFIQPLKYDRLSERLSYASRMQTQQFHPRRDSVKVHRWVRLSFIQFSVRHCDLYLLLLILLFLHAVRSEQGWIIVLIQLFLKCMEESQLLPQQLNSHLYGTRKLVPWEWRKGHLLEEPTVGCEGCRKHPINLRNLFKTVSSDTQTEWFSSPCIWYKCFWGWWNFFGHKEINRHTFKIPNH